MKHILTMDILPRYTASGPTYNNYRGGGSKRYGD